MTGVRLQKLKRSGFLLYSDLTEKVRVDEFFEGEFHTYLFEFIVFFLTKLYYVN